MLFDVVESGLARRLGDAVFVRYCPWAASGTTVRPLWVGPTGLWPGAGSFDAIVIIGGVFAGPPFVNVLMQAFTLGAKPELFDPRVVVAWYGVGLDDSVLPVARPEWRAYLRALAGRLDFFTVRSPSAAARFQQAGAPVPRIVPDPSFALPVRENPRPPPRGRRPRIGVAVGEATASGRFLDTIAGLRIVLRYVRRSGYDLTTCLDPAEIVDRELAEDVLTRKRDFSRRLLAELADLRSVGTVEFIAVDNMYDDAATATAMAAALGGARVRHLGPACAKQLGEVLRSYDIVVVSRFHSVVLALQAGVPFIVADPYWCPDAEMSGAGTSKVHQLLAALGCTRRHWTGAKPGTTMPDLAELVLCDAEGDRDRYATLHVRAVEAMDELAAVISSGPPERHRAAARAASRRDTRC